MKMKKCGITFERKLNEHGDAYEIVEGDIYCPVQTGGPVTGFHRMLAIALKKRYSGLLEVSDLDMGEVCIVMNLSSSIDMFEFTELIKKTLSEFYKSLGRRRRSDVQLLMVNTLKQYENLLAQKAWTAVVYLITGAPRHKMNYETDEIVDII
jgi:hypothetical protein